MTGCSSRGDGDARALKVLKRKKCVASDYGRTKIDVDAFKRHFRSDLVLADVTEITRLV